MAGGDAARWAEIASLTALVVAGLSVLAWLLRLSGLVSFISGTILIGFKAGAAFTIALTQLPKLFGVPGGGDNFFERAWILAGQLGQTNLVVFGFGLAALVLLLLGDRLLPGRPIALFVVATLCWLPVVRIQIRMRDLARAAAAAEGVLPPRYWRYLAWWVALGTVAFVCFVAVFYLMVAKPL